MDDKMPKGFTDEEIKELTELCKDAVRWTLSEKDFKKAKLKTITLQNRRIKR